ncbi:MAG: hypothetical protein AAF554_17870 [Bacteroidota bacterium]
MILFLKKLQPARTACVTLLFSFHFFGSAQNTQDNVYQTFDYLIGIENSGVFKGTVNLPYPNVRPENHPFYKTADYAQMNMVYDQQTYVNIAGRYDLIQSTLEILPDKQTNLPPITMAPELLQGFTIDGTAFEKHLLPKTEEVSFFAVLLSNAQFKLLQKHEKQGKERIRNRNQIYAQYVETTSLYINTKNQMYPVKGKKDVFKIFPEAKEQLNQYFKETPKGKKGDDAIIDVLNRWDASINEKNS